MRAEGAARAGRRTRAWLVAAVALFSPAVTGVPGGLEPWHLVMALLGLVAVCAATLELAGEHRELVSAHSWLDAVSGVMGTAAVLLTFAAAPLERAGGMDVTEASLTLSCLAALVVVTGLGVTLAVEVGPAADPRAVVLLSSSAALLAAGAGYVLDAAGAVDVAAALGAALAAAGCSGLLAVLVLPHPRAVERRATGTTQLAFGSFAVIAQAALALLLAPPGWSLQVVVVVSVGALVTAGLRLAVLLRDVTSLHEARALAVTDEVTGLGNRRGVLADVASLHPRPVGGPSGAALLVVDVDGLSAVNDVWGSEVVDALLERVGRRLVASAGTAGVRVARLHGGTFALLQPCGGEAAALATASSAHHLLAEPFELPQGSARLRVAAAGVALVGAEHGADGGGSAVDVLRRAEAAVSRSRTCGGGPVLHDAALDVAAAARAELAAALAGAISSGQLVLHYQPQLLSGGRVVHGVEALVRWRDPEHGLVPPDVFVPLAEELGLQGALTRWVVGEALREVARWRTAGVCVPVSVNLSPSDLQPELVDDVASALTAAGVPGRSLVLEITETGIVSDPGSAAAVLTALGELGVEISIDDYGTGYSSLSLLMALPVTELKIDRVFVRDLASDARSAVVVRTTVDLAHSLGLRVVAEGVETAEVLTRLHELGCDATQGYLHSRPLPAEEVRAWLLDGVQRPVQQALRQVAVAGA